MLLPASKGVLLAFVALSFSLLQLSALRRSEVLSPPVVACDHQNNVEVVAGTTTAESNTQPDRLAGSLAKLRQQITADQEEHFDRSKPIYIDFGLSDGADTAHHLSKGYSVVAVDAFLPWISKAKEKFASEIAANRLLLLNVGLATEEAEAMPLYYKQEGSVIASFVKEKGCQGALFDPTKCHHTNVEVVRCESILHLINAQAELMKVDIEMLHHTCIRGLHRIPTHLLPKYVCWEEHDKPFGPARVERPVTDAKLIMGLSELGYDGVKIVMQGPKAWKFYGIDRDAAGFGQGSGTQTPEEMMHYRSYEDHENGNFDTQWRPVHEIFSQGIFGPGTKDKPSHFFNVSGGTYYDICMKLSPNAANARIKLHDPESFPLASYAEQ